MQYNWSAEYEQGMELEKLEGTISITKKTVWILSWSHLQAVE